ncbi:MAG: arsenate reductase family protein [Gemmatimonadales bacterium]
MEVQVFGVRKDAATRAALRFFAERRIRIHFVDLAERAASRGELSRFAQKFGVEALVDRAGRRFAELGLAAGRYSETQWLEKLVAEPRLLRTPLIRYGSQLTVGSEEAVWRQWADRRHLPPSPTP